MKPGEKLTERIIMEPVTRANQLSPADREALDGDPLSTQALEENRGLASLAPDTEPIPDRAVVLGRVFASVDAMEEPKMTLINRWFSGKRWYLQAGMAVALLLAVTVVALLPVEKSWGQADGYMLSYDLGPQTPESAQTLIQDTLMPQVKAALVAFAERHADESGEKTNQLLLNIMVNEDGAKMSIGLVENNDELLAELQADLAEIAELPEPSLQPMTWFFDGKAPCCLGNEITVNIEGRTFSFPNGTPEEEIEAQLNAWLLEKDPEHPGNVDVDIEQTGDEMRLEIRLEPGDAEAEK
ncbi:hypothetical protein JW859_15155 [bacterium]|nr:hypothetical protein [bacterium]